MKFKVGKEVSGTKAEVCFDSIGEISEALNALSVLSHSVIIEEMKIRAKTLWIKHDDGQRISETVSDSGERVALSLLDSWPNPKSNSEMVSETGLSSAAVYDQLHGRRGNKGSWFRQEGDLYTLTETGEENLVKLVSRISHEEE